MPTPSSSTPASRHNLDRLSIAQREILAACAMRMQHSFTSIMDKYDRSHNESYMRDASRAMANFRTALIGLARLDLLDQQTTLLDLRIDALKNAKRSNQTPRKSTKNATGEDA